MMNNSQFEKFISHPKVKKVGENDRTISFEVNGYNTDIFKLGVKLPGLISTINIRNNRYKFVFYKQHLQSHSISETKEQVKVNLL